MFDNFESRFSIIICPFKDKFRPRTPKINPYIGDSSKDVSLICSQRISKQRLKNQVI